MHDPTPAYARLDAGISDPLIRAAAQAIAIYQAHGLDSLTGQAALRFAGDVAWIRRESENDATEDPAAIRDLIDIVRTLIRDDPDGAVHLGRRLVNLKRGHADIRHKLEMLALDSAAHDTEAAS